MKKKAPVKEPYTSQAVLRALKMLETLGQVQEAQSLQSLCERLGLAKASAFRLMHTLEEAGYVGKDASGGYFAVGRGSLQSARYRRQLPDAASSAMLRLRRRFRETVSLAALFDNHVEVVEVFESPEFMRMSNTVGRILPPHASSLGKAIAAFQAAQRRETLVRSYGIYRYTEKTIVDESDLQQEFEEIRRRGHAVDAEENTSGGRCHGVPLLDGSGTAFAALSVSMPTSRHKTESAQQRIVEALKESAENIVREFGST